MKAPVLDPVERPLSRRTCLVIIAIYAVVALCLVPVAAIPGPTIPGVTAVFGGVILAIDLATSFILFSYFFETPFRSLLMLASAYLFSALMVVPHVLAFPGAIVPGAALIDFSPQSPGWIFVLWIGGYSILTLCAVVLAARVEQPLQPEAADKAVVVAFVAVIGLWLALSFLTTVFVDALPSLVGGARWTLLNRAITAVSLMLLVSGIAVCLWRTRGPFGSGSASP